MIEKLSDRITDFLISSEVINRQEREIYHYGYEVLLMNLMVMTELFVCGILIRQFWLTFLFTLVFCSVRACVGGYHAGTMVRCNWETLLLWGINLLTVNQAVKSRMDVEGFLLAGVFFYIMVIFQYAPVEHKNKPVSEEVFLSNRKKGRILTLLFTGVAILIFGICPKAGVSIVITMEEVALLVLIEIRKKKEVRKC